MSSDTKPHLLVVFQDGDETAYEIEHPGCATELVELDSISGDREAVMTYERYTCRMQWVLDYWGLDFLEHPDGRSKGWGTLAPGHYGIFSYTDGDDTGVALVNPAALEVSEQITMRPVWARRQRRYYLQAPLDAPTQAEIHDAIKVLEDEENQFHAPALYLEAFTIFDEASSPKGIHE